MEMIHLLRTDNRTQQKQHQVVD